MKNTNEIEPESDFIKIYRCKFCKGFIKTGTTTCANCNKPLWPSEIIVTKTKVDAKNEILARIQQHIFQWIMANRNDKRPADPEWKAHIDVWFELDKILNPKNYLKEKKFLQQFLEFKP